jgi:hypothetical protein
MISEGSVSQESFLEFLIAARGSVAELTRYNRRNLSEVLFHAKNEGFDFTAEEAREVIGRLEANIILAKDQDPFDGTSRLWRAQWGLRHFEYLVDHVLSRHTDEELRSLVGAHGQEIL